MSGHGMCYAHTHTHTKNIRSLEILKEMMKEERFFGKCVQCASLRPDVYFANFATYRTISVAVGLGYINSSAAEREEEVRGGQHHAPIYIYTRRRFWVLNCFPRQNSIHDEGRSSTRPMRRDKLECCPAALPDGRR